MKILFLLFLVPLLAIAGCAPAPAAYTQISMAEAEKLMGTEGVVLVDVRTRAEFAAGHIPGAICIPVESISSPPEELPDMEQTILIYCRSGNRSKQAAEKLAAMGYTNIIECGGIRDWTGPLAYGEE